MSEKARKRRAGELHIAPGSPAACWRERLSLSLSAVEPINRLEAELSDDVSEWRLQGQSSEDVMETPMLSARVVQCSKT